MRINWNDVWTRVSCSPLKRMTVGMFLAALAFIAAALVQIQIDVSVTHKNVQRATATYAKSYEAQPTRTCTQCHFSCRKHCLRSHQAMKPKWSSSTWLTQSWTSKLEATTFRWNLTWYCSQHKTQYTGTIDSEVLSHRTLKGEGRVDIDFSFCYRAAPSTWPLLTPSSCSWGLMPLTLPV